MIGLVLPFLLASPTVYVSLDRRKRRSRKRNQRNQNAIFTRSLSPMLLISTLTPSSLLMKILGGCLREVRLYFKTEYFLQNLIQL